MLKQKKPMPITADTILIANDALFAGAKIPALVIACERPVALEYPNRRHPIITGTVFLVQRAEYHILLLHKRMVSTLYFSSALDK